MSFLNNIKNIMGMGKKVVVGGIDLGSNTTKAVQVNKTPSGYQLARVAVGPTPAMTIKDGAVVDAKVLADSLRQLLDGSKMVLNKVVGTVTGQSVVIRPIIMTQMTEKELQHAIKFEAERYLPYSVSEAQIVGNILRKSIEGDEKSMEVLLVAAPNEIVKNVGEVVAQAGMQLQAIDLEPFALARAVQFSVTPEIFKQTLAIINLGASSSTINIFKAGTLRHNRTISVAGNSFTKSIGQSLNLSFEEAEKIKKDKGVIRVEKDATPVAPTSMRIFNVIIPVLNELITEVQRSFDYYRSRYRGETLDLILLSGGTACFKNIGPYMANELGIQTQIVNPVKNMVPGDVPGFTQEELDAIAPSLTVSMGLAFRSFI